MIGVLLTLVIALLAVPLTVVFSIHRIEDTRGYVRFRWLFGLVSFELRIPQAAQAERRPESGAGKVEKLSRRKEQESRAGELFSLLKQSAFRQRIYKFIRDMLRATHARNLFLRLRIGLGDPADTGCLWAIIGPIAGMAQNFRSAAVRIEPEFIDPVFEVESHGRFRLVPIQFLALVAAFMLSPVMLRAWRHLYKGNA
ncbi:MAG: DUF2953 domain-containing protein [Alphaproteobacteria bacterium]|nr:DUF2953 domain-containing protein [Alphaproteobacteria bacterium]